MLVIDTPQKRTKNEHAMQREHAAESNSEAQNAMYSRDLDILAIVFQRSHTIAIGTMAWQSYKS